MRIFAGCDFYAPLQIFFHWHKNPSENCSTKNLYFRLLITPVHILKMMLIMRIVFL